MGIIDLYKKLLQTSTEALEQRYSGPEAVLERYIGELKDNLESSRAAVNALRLEVERLQNRARELKADEDMWESKARAALQKLNDEELAREALRRKARAAAEYKELESIIEGHKRDIGVMEKSLRPLEKKLDDAKSKKERLAARMASDGARNEVKGRLDDSGIGNFKEVEEQLLELEARADALNDLKLLSVKDAYRPGSDDDDELEKELKRLREESGKKGLKKE